MDSVVQWSDAGVFLEENMEICRFLIAEFYTYFINRHIALNQKFFGFVQTILHNIAFQ